MIPRASTANTYTVAVDESISPRIGFAESTFVFREKTMYSEAIHVNNIGYLSDASMKYGYVSHYLGEMGGMSYSSGTPFHLVHARTGSIAFSGTLKERSGTGHYKVRVWECDFSSFSKPGEYRLVVEGVGCSYPFAIDVDAYRSAFQGACRGMLHQRCGCELTPDITMWPKPSAVVNEPPPRRVQHKAQASVMRKERHVYVAAPLPVRAEVFDMSGRRLVHTAPSHTHGLALTHCTAGLYLIRVRGKGIRSTRTISIGD